VLAVDDGPPPARSVACADGLDAAPSSHVGDGVSTAENVEAFGAILRRERIAAALTQERLAERARISATGIAALEAGRRKAPRATTVALLIDALHLDGDAKARLIAAAAAERRGTSTSDSAEVHVGDEPTGATDPRRSTASTKSSSLVGRVSELEILRMAAVSGARVVVVVGEAGVGKTRLVREFLTELGPNIRMLWGQCTAHRLGSYEPFVTPVRQAVAAMPSATGTVGQLARLVPELAGDQAWTDQATNADHDVERRLLFEAAATLFQGLGPTVLVLDDLHWADAGSLSLLAFLAVHAGLGQLLIVATVRTTDLTAATAAAIADLRRRTDVVRVDLHGLSPEGVRSLVRRVAGERTSPRLLDAVSSAAGGNPLFVLELTEHLLARDFDAEQHENSSVTGIVPVPQGIAETLIARLTALSPDAQQLVRTGAVLGRSFNPDAAASLGSLTADRVLAATEDALLSGLLDEVSAREVTFTHGLVQSAVYDSLSARRRLDLHRRAARMIEQQSTPLSDASTFDIARHWAAVAVEDPTVAAAAATWAHRAGDAASAAADIDQAIGQYERAEHLWVGPTAEHAETLLSLGFVLSSRSRSDEADRRFRAALGLADALGDQRLFARAAIGLATTVRYGVAEPDRIALLERALAGLGPDDDVLRAMTAAMLKRQLGFDRSEAAYQRRQQAAAIVLEAVSQPVLSHELLLTLGAARDAITVDDPRILDRLSRATVAVGVAERRLHVAAHGWYGRAWAALELADGPGWHEAVEAFAVVAQELDVPFEQALANTMRATTALIEGRYPEAEALASRAHAIGSGADPNADTILLTTTVIAGVDLGRGPAMVALMRANRAQLAEVPTFLAGLTGTAAFSGETELARELLDEHLAAGLGSVRRDLEWLPVMGFLASTAARIGAADAARELYDLLVEHPALAIRVGPIAGWWGPTDHHLGGLCRLMGRFDEAERRLRRSLRTSGLMGSPPWQVRSQIELAHVLELQHHSTGRVIGTEAAELRSAAAETAACLSAPGLLA
jgi:transcriptional regulator with XRE-family HTH domain/tetratricopeptide (TPR) repeat protein